VRGFCRERGLRFGLFGPGWNALYPDDGIADRREDNGELIYQRSKVTFQTNWASSCSTRTFNAILSGTLPLCKDLGALDYAPGGILTLLEDGREVVTYTTFDDLGEKIVYYGDHIEERNTIIRAAQTKLLSSVTYETNFRNLFSELSQAARDDVRR
jgi:spore maturation protein CgeB